MYSSPFRHSTCPVARAFAFDLHVLATPPAFVLSQDQTLHLIIVLARWDADQQSLKLLGCRTPEGDHSLEPRPLPLKASGFVRWKT